MFFVMSRSGTMPNLLELDIPCPSASASAVQQPVPLSDNDEELITCSPGFHIQMEYEMDWQRSQSPPDLLAFPVSQSDGMADADILEATIRAERKEDVRATKEEPIDPLVRHDPWPQRQATSAAVAACSAPTGRASFNSPLLPHAGPLATAPSMVASPLPNAWGQYKPTAKPLSGTPGSSSASGGPSSLRPAASPPASGAAVRPAPASQSQHGGGRAAPLQPAGDAPCNGPSFPPPPVRAAQVLQPPQFPASLNNDPQAVRGVNELLAEWNTNAEQIVAANNHKIKQDLQATVHHLLQQYDANIQAQFRAQQADIAKLYELVAQLKDDKSKVWREVSHLSQTVESSPCPAAAKEFRQAQQFDALPNECIIVVTCKSFIDRVSLLDGIAQWMADAALQPEQDYDIPGGDTNLAKRWVITFGGDHGLQARRARKCLNLLKGSDGIWRRLKAISPLGEAVDLFLSADKSKKRIATEVLTKRLHGLIQDQLGQPTRALHMLKPEGLVTYQWKPLAKVTANADGSAVCQWNPVVADKLQIDRVCITDAMENRRTVSTDGVEWCR